MPHTGDLAHNPGMCPDLERNQQPFGLQAGTQATEPQEPGLKVVFELQPKVAISFSILLRLFIK